MTHIFKCAFKGTFASFDGVGGLARSTSFDGVGGLAQSTFCRADPAMENEGSDSDTPIQLCVSGKYDVARKTGLTLSIPHLQHIFGLLI